MDRRTLVYAPRAQRDIDALEAADARRVLEDLELLERPPWPPRKVKRLRGCEFWEVKTGDFRTIFWPEGRKVVILRVVNRRDLDQSIGRINLGELVRWIRTWGPGGS